jgi:hypothetical protein
MRPAAGLVLCAIFAAACGVTAVAGPRTGLVPKSWELHFEFEDPQRITIESPTGEAVTYWYVVYRVINRSGQDVLFLPTFSLVTDTGKVVDAGENVNPLAYDRIAARHRGQPEFAFFAPPSKVTGLLLQGEANARSSAAVFQQFDPNASSFRIYVTGLSGERVREPNKAFDPDKPISEQNPQAFLLSRTLEITYDLPGDSETRAAATPKRRTRAWVLR